MNLSMVNAQIIIPIDQYHDVKHTQFKHHKD